MGPGGAQLFTDGRWALGRGSHLAGVATHVKPRVVPTRQPPVVAAT